MGRPDEYAAPLSKGQVALGRLKLSAEMVALLQDQLPADTPAAVHAVVVMAQLRGLEDALTKQRLIPPPARGGEGRHIP